MMRLKKILKFQNMKLQMIQTLSQKQQMNRQKIPKAQTLWSFQGRSSTTLSAAAKSLKALSYMNHHYVEALLMCGKKDQAMDYMKYYWGGMINHGADTFWELYNPENPAESPYGSSIVNSYCHAWSCTPTYLLRKYFLK